MLVCIDCRKETDWLDAVVSEFHRVGFAAVAGVWGDGYVEETTAALYEAARRIEAEIGPEKLLAARARGETETRLILKYHGHFLRILENERLLQIADVLLSPTCTLRFLNGSIYPPQRPGDPVALDTRWHRNCRQVMNGYLAYLDFFVPLQDTTTESGAIEVVPGSQQRPEPPGAEEFEARAIELCMPKGTLLVFDSTLWHRQLGNRSTTDRLYVDLQLTRAFIKPHFDYVRALGDDRLALLPERTKQLLGWYTRVPTSLEEFYVVPEQRLYRAGQD